MRVTQAQRDETRRRIVATARKLLSKKGFEATTTRDLATRAGIASGTFFNYFDTKESLVTTLVTEALVEAENAFESSRRLGGDLEEQLFTHLAACLRALAPHRSYIQPVIERSLSPFDGPDRGEQTFRSIHLETVNRLLHSAGHRDVDAAALHIYWGLYVAVLSFWTRDESPNQEDTLALLDRSMKLFMLSLRPPSPMEEDYDA